MAQAAKKVNFMLSDDVRREFEQLVPPGERSRVVNEALRRELTAIKRRKLTERLMLLRAKNIRLATKEIVEAVKKDRERR